MNELHSDPPIQLRNAEIWNQPWQELLKKLAQLRGDDPAAASLVSPSKRAPAVSPIASWLGRARQRS